MTNNIAIPLSPFFCPEKTCAKTFEEQVKGKTIFHCGHSRRGLCAQRNGDKGMVLSLMDALVGVPDLELLGVVRWDTALRTSSHVREHQR